jgi:hypothetical protein
MANGGSYMCYGSWHNFLIYNVANKNWIGHQILSKLFTIKTTDTIKTIYKFNIILKIKNISHKSLLFFYKNVNTYVCQRTKLTLTHLEDRSQPSL